MVSFFTFSIFIQSVAMFYCATHSIKQVTGIKKDKYIIIPLSVIVFFVTFVLGFDINNYANFLAFPWPQICAILSTLIPFILIFTALVKGKLKKQTTSS